MDSRPEGTPDARSSRPLLREREFSRLFSARLVSEFGSAMTPVAIAFAVLDLTGDAAQVGLVVAAQIAAQVLLQLLGGALADRGSRQRLMVRADVLATGSQAAMAALLLTGRAEVGLLMALMAVNGAALALHGPAAIGLVPQVVPVERLQSANALLGMARSGALALGAACAGLIVAGFGAGWALAVDAASFGAAAVLVATLRPTPQRRSPVLGLWRELREGWGEFTAHRWLWVIVLQFSLLVAGFEGTNGVIGPTVAKRAMAGATDWGWIASAMGAGTLAGGLVSLRLTVARPMLVASWLCFPFALPPLLLSGPAPVGWIAAGAFVSGVCGQIFAVLWYTTLQRHVPPEALSRVSAYDHLGSVGLAPLGVVFAGALIEAVGAREACWLAAALVVAPTAAVLCVRDVRSLRADASRR